MLNETRWLIEIALMRERFPGFRDFVCWPDGMVGFRGSLRGSEDGPLCEVVVEIPVDLYPEHEPAVYIQPRVGSACDFLGKLSYVRPQGWQPAKHTFASCVLLALAYLRDQKGVKTLALPDGMFAEIVALSRAYEGLEFAVTLFGFIRGERFEVTHLAKPGPESRHERGLCTGDDQFESDFFYDLRKKEPGIQWLGDLHAHPPSYPRLSGTDHRTIRRILFGTDRTLHPAEYVAGIILPLRRAGEPGVVIVPTYFSKENPSGSEMELEYVSNGICTKPQRARRLFRTAYCHRRPWHDWLHARRHPGPDGSGEAHPD